ncbi:hypothetical protein [Paeniglutamicibacter sp. NPDC091659]|uniref:hypothetical protein n=1 Tax=Paeniglutamicibacter sp. NPDC091659 TaxID=3364389 RepID=UPI003818AB67
MNDDELLLEAPQQRACESLAAPLPWGQVKLAPAFQQLPWQVLAAAKSLARQHETLARELPAQLVRPLLPQALGLLVDPQPELAVLPARQKIPKPECCLEQKKMSPASHFL